VAVIESEAKEETQQEEEEAPQKLESEAKELQ
jgi:hypothetical protein